MDVNSRLIKRVADVICSDFPSLLRLLKTGRTRAGHPFRPLFNKDFCGEHAAQHYLASARFDDRMADLGSNLHFDIFREGLSELLRYTDRNAMAHGRAVRLRCLDHELVRLQLGLSRGLTFRDGWAKYIIRETFATKLPPEIVWRRGKVGYDALHADWLRSVQGPDAARDAVALLKKEGVLSSRYEAFLEGGEMTPGTSAKNGQVLVGAGLFG